MGIREIVEWIGIFCWPFVIAAIVWFLANLQYAALKNHEMIMENQRMMKNELIIENRKTMDRILYEILTRLPEKPKNH